MTDAKDDKLTQLIADAIEQTEAGEKERLALAKAEQIEVDNLMAEATRKALSNVQDFPAALLPHCQAAQGPGCWNSEDSIEQLKKGWLPERFTIDAPGLVRISFATFKNRFGSYLVTGISFNGLCGTTTDWTQAIAGAAKKFQESEERLQIHQREYERAKEAEPIKRSIQMTTAERLEQLIRGIAREAMTEEGERE